MMDKVNHSSNQATLARAGAGRSRDEVASSEAPRRKAAGAGSSENDGAAFEATLMGASAMSNASQPKLTPKVEGVVEKPGSKSSLTGTLTDAIPQTQKPAASLNTAAAIAGPKPWSKNWIFEGRPDPLTAENNGGAGEMKPLLSLLAGQGKGGAQEASEREVADGTKDIAVNAANSDLMRALMGGEAGANDAVAKAGAQAQAIAEGMSAAAQASGNAGVALSQLDAQVSALNGEFGSTQTTGGATGPKGLSGAGLKGAGPQGALSGGEFLNTLSAIRGGVVGPAGNNGQNPNGSEGGSDSGKEGMKDSSKFRVIEGGAPGSKDRKASRLGEGDLFLGNSATLQAVPGHSQAAGTVATPTVELTGHVTKGAMSQDRLSSESLSGLSTGISSLSQSGGEIRIRLNPGNLGELNLRVVTDGSNVGLKIQASDDKAKKILEESLGHLKESLASHRLTLGSVDLTVATASGTSLGNEAKQDGGSQHSGYNPSQSGGQFDMMGQQSNSQQGSYQRSAQWGGEEAIARMPGTAGRASSQSAAVSSGYAIPTGAASRSAYLGNGRVDVRA